MNPAVIIQFALATLLPVVASVVLTLLIYRTKLGEKGYWFWQIVCGLIFGAIAIFGTEMGIDYSGATMNVRDAAPIVAGLYFGGPAGIIAGIIGGVERWFAALWGRGEFTRVGCSVATIFAGLFVALLNKILFARRKPSWPLAMAIGMVVEVVHLLLIFLTNIDDATHAYLVASACLKPMVFCNGVSVALSSIGISLASGNGLRKRQELPDISQRVQLRMLGAVVALFVCTLLPVAAIENSLSHNDNAALLATSIDDAVQDVRDAKDESYAHAKIRTAVANRHVGQSGQIVVIAGDNTVIGSRIDVTYSDEAVGELLRDLEDVQAKQMFETVFLGKTYYAMYDIVDDIRVVALLPAEEGNLSRDLTIMVITFIEIIIFAGVFIAIYPIVEQIVVRDIWRVNGRLAQITGGNLGVKVDVRGSTEFALLSDDINTTVGALRSAIDAEASRIDRELQYARDIQQSALQSVFPAFPDHSDFDLYAAMYAAREVGGDFYDFYLLDDDRLAFLIADVSGKGIPAALFMMRAKTSFRNLLETGSDVSDVFEQVNAQLCEGNDTEMFVTAWMGVIDLTSGHVRYANAGHNPPAVSHNGQSFELLSMYKNVFLGWLDDYSYRVNELDLNPGDVLFLYTDGIVEANNPKEQLYGSDRLLAVLDDSRQCTMRGLCENVIDDVNRFADGTPQFDDMTLLALRYNGRG